MSLYTIQFSRQELEWLYRRLISGKDKAEGLIKTYTEPAGKVLNAEQNRELVETIKYKDALEKFTLHLSDTLGHHDKQRVQLTLIKEELQEAYEIVEEPEAKAEAKKQMSELPSAPPINISFDKNTLKFTLKLIEKDLLKFRSVIIPNYEKTPAEEFTDKIRTKSYFVAKARKGKNILEKMKVKLEKGL